MGVRHLPFAKLSPSDEVRHRYQQAVRRFTQAGDPLTREVWQLVKDELETIYQF